MFQIFDNKIVLSFQRSFLISIQYKIKMLDYKSMLIFIFENWANVSESKKNNNLTFIPIFVTDIFILFGHERKLKAA